MMKPIEETESTYRTAMALNNLGVSMMTEQGGLHHAMMLFKDAFAVMSSEQYIPSGGEFGDVFLPVSQDQTAQLQEQSFRVMAQACLVPLHPLEICPCDDEDVCLMTKTLPNVSIFVPINLRSHYFYDPQGSRKNANLSLAIIMYNHGLAHLLAHVQDKRWNKWGQDLTATSHQGQKLLRGAVVSLNCAQVMIDCHLDMLGNDNLEKLGTLLLSAMTSKTIMWMSRLAGQGREAEQARALLTQAFGDIDLCQRRLRELNINMYNHETSAAA
jgi:hypothetical protein